VVTASTIKFKHEIITFFHIFYYCVSRECENKILGLLYPYKELADLIFLAGAYEGWNFNSGNYLFTTDTK